MSCFDCMKNKDGECQEIPCNCPCHSIQRDLEELDEGMKEAEGR